ncbi:hypothetical protein [Rugosimonospora africana]|uniref:Uncharacterized protein n=1 Tax=Rugosimonospora africana TaxID=556532 RepID=A0A8J3VP28_9ACTN|nr:hypothetical protein [Rugosimonospora africana]GIH13749.1 hypothetical protein Raf01_19210 [Rugosimonospora africana]
MRRIALAVIAAAGAVFLPLTSAYAAPDPAATIPVPPAKPGQAVCKVDKQLTSLVGLTATASGYAVVDKPNNGALSLRIYQMNGSCQRTTPIIYSGGSGEARDPRDIQLSSDGKNYWVADTGDDLQNPERPTIGLWKIPVNKSKGTLYHFTFPQGDGPYDADALLIGSDNSPVFVTHPLTGPAGIYVPTAAPNPSGDSVALKKAGTFTPQKTGTANKLGPPGGMVVTGGAVSPDGKKVVLRTFSDAYEWDVIGGDIAKTLTTGTPRITPLPNEDQGEAITYSHDGKYFLTVSNLPSGQQTTMLRYSPAVPVAVKKAETGGTSGSGGGGGQGWFASLSPTTKLTLLVSLVGIIGLFMVIGGVVGIRRARKRPVPVGQDAGSADADEWAQPREPVGASTRGRLGPDRPSGAVYGGTRGGAPDDGYSNARSGGRPGDQGGRPGDQGGRPGDPGGRPGAPGGRPGQAPPPRGRTAPPQSGGTYRSGGQGGGMYQSGDQDGGDRGDRRGSGRERGGPGGGTYSGGSYSGGTYSSGGYEPPAQQPGPPPPRTGGVARSHRPGRGSRDNAPPPRRAGGYSEEHDGFDDLRRLTEE